MLVICVILTLALLASAVVGASEAPVEWVFDSGYLKCQTRHYDITSEVDPYYLDLTGLDEAFEDLEESLRAAIAGKIRITIFSSGFTGDWKGYTGAYSHKEKMIKLYPTSKKFIGTIIHESVHYIFREKAGYKSDPVSNVLLHEAAAHYFGCKVHYAGDPSRYSRFVERAINRAKEVSNKYPSWKKILKTAEIRTSETGHHVYLAVGLYLAETYGEGIFGDLLANYDKPNPVKSTFGVTPAQLEEGFYGWLWAQ